MSVYTVNILMPEETFTTGADEVIILAIRRRILKSYSTIEIQRIEGGRRSGAESFSPYLTVCVETDDAPENKIMEGLIGFNEKCIKIAAEETIRDLIDEYFKNQHSFTY
jgi:hypothetical protein